MPSVGKFAQGMIVQIPLHLKAGKHQPICTRRWLITTRARASSSVVEAESLGARIDPQRLNGTNQMELSVHGDAETGRAVLLATLDNLGKGASGAAVQNLNIMLGLDEATGL